MLVGPKRVLFMDEISTGLDSSTTYQVRSEAAVTGVCSNEPSHEVSSKLCTFAGNVVTAASAGPIPLSVQYFYVRVWKGSARSINILHFVGLCRNRAAWAAPQIVKYLRDATHELRYTTMVALLQPAPETYELFDDVLLLSDGACA